MRVERLVLGRPASADLEGSILTRDLAVGGARWAKGRRLTAADLALLSADGAEPRGFGAARDQAAGAEPRTITLLVPEAGDLHEDDAAIRLAEALAAGETNLELRGPVQSRVDLHAAKDGLVAVRVGRLERLNRIDPLEVFTVLDGQVVGRGELVASVKVAPHVVPERVVATAEAIVRTGLPLVRIRPFGGRRVAVVVKESVAGAARERFEASIRLRIEGLGAEVAAFRYIADEPEAATEALRELTRRGAGIDLVLTAGGASTDPADPFFVALDGLGGRLVRRGVPAHPGSMLWLGRVGRTAVLGLPTCGAYSKATAADLLIPRLLAGEPPTARTVARLAHGGVLTRDQRFRFPTYARTLEAPDG